VNLTGVTARYARAFIQAADERDILDRARGDAEALLELLDSSDELKVFVKDPLIRADEKQKVVEEMFSGKLHGVTLNFLCVLCSKRRERGLEEILQGVLMLLDDRQGIATAEVRSAQPLTDPQREALLQRLSSVSGKQIRLNETVDASLKAGFVARLGDQVFDGTVSAQLDRLRRTLMQRS
jgi:F-type H+-transporting ATPase subunit delta